MVVSAWWTLVLAIPVLVIGEFLVKRSRVLARFNAPASVVGGLLVAFLVLAGNASGAWRFQFQTDVTAAWWTWLGCSELEWLTQPTMYMATPFILMFFACIGLGTSWRGLMRDTKQVLAFLGVAATLAVLQNVVGVVLAKALNLPPLLGLVCGSISLTGGHFTALGFAGELERSGVPNALGISMAVATCGIMTSAIVGGLLARFLIQQRGLRSKDPSGVPRTSDSAGEGLFHDMRSLLFYGGPFLTHILHSARTGILGDLRTIFRLGRTTVLHLGIILLCVKLGSWFNYWIMHSLANFPVYVGAMLVGMAVRAGLDLTRRDWIRPALLDNISSVALGLFITSAMMSLNLAELSHGAGPILTIVGVQVLIAVLFAWLLTFRVMGRDYDAAVMTSGHIGFSLGETPNAVANMKALVEVFGPAPRAFLVVALGSSFLIKLFNAVNISLFLKLLQD